MHQRKSKLLREFYKEYYNKNYYRDIDYISEAWRNYTGAEPMQKTRRLRFKVKGLTTEAEDVLRFKKEARFFLINPKYREGMGQIVAHSSYFRTISDFHNKNTGDRIYDRLFFDIDKHNKVINGFKHDINELKAKQLNTDTGFNQKRKERLIREVQKEYKQYILNTDFLLEPYEQSQQIIQFYHERGAEPLLIYTGGAGFHLNLFYKPAHLQNIQYIVKSYQQLISKKCNIPIDDKEDTGKSNLDSAVVDNARNGNQRVPYTVHEKSGVTGFIITSDMTYEDILKHIKHDKAPINEDFQYYAHTVPEELNRQILDLDRIANETIQLKKQQEQQKTRRTTSAITTHHTGKLPADLRELWELLVKDGMAEPVRDKDHREHYNRVRCPFPDHEDRTPSAICGPHRFKCFKCCPDGINWYMLIAVTYGIIPPSEAHLKVTREQKLEIKKIIHHLLR